MASGGRPKGVTPCGGRQWPDLGLGKNDGRERAEGRAEGAAGVAQGREGNCRLGVEMGAGRAKRPRLSAIVDYC